MYRERAINEMKRVFKEIPYGIEHTMRVLNNADEIMTEEISDEKIKTVISLAAILHDIGAVEAQRKHGSIDGRFQEIEGPAIAKAILERVGATDESIARVCYIVGHHHTPSKINGMDFQIVWEADTLDDLEFGKHSRDREQIRLKIQENFQTASGRRLAFERCRIA